ncbi:MAG: EamA family transporter [Synergistaceae bacterium]|nr:EamA family transporter [Synergistaceae bacterium]
MQSKNKYLIMLLASIIIFGSVGVLRRQIDLSSALIAFCRGIIGASFILCIIRGRIQRVGLKTFLQLVISGAFLGINWLFLFESYNFTSVPVATLFCYTSPAMIIILSAIFLNEGFTGKKFICLALSLTGMILISGVLDSGGIASNDVRGILCALVSALLYSLVVIMNKSISGVDVYTKTITQLIFSAVALLPYLILTGEFFSGEWSVKAVIFLIIISLINTGIAYILYFASLEKLKAHTVALLSYLDPLTALILSSLILGESLTFTGLIGAALILVSSLMCEI